MPRVVLVAALVLALAGCSSPADDIQAALDESHSAVASVVIAAKLQQDGKLPEKTLLTSTDDALAALEGAQSALDALTPGEQASARHDALAKISDARDAVLALQEALDTGGDVAAARAELKRIDEELQR